MICVLFETLILQGAKNLNEAEHETLLLNTTLININLAMELFYV